MILQPVTRHIHRKTVLRVGLFLLKVLVFLPFSLLAQPRSTVFATIPMVSATHSAMPMSGQYRAEAVAVTNDRPDHE